EDKGEQQHRRDQDRAPDVVGLLERASLVADRVRPEDRTELDLPEDGRDGEREHRSGQDVGEVQVVAKPGSKEDRDNPDSGVDCRPEPPVDAFTSRARPWWHVDSSLTTVGGLVAARRSLPVNDR